MLKDMLQISGEAWQCLDLSGCAEATQGGQPSFLGVPVLISWGGRGDSSPYCACIEQSSEVTSPEAQPSWRAFSHHLLWGGSVAVR